MRHKTIGAVCAAFATVAASVALVPMANAALDGSAVVINEIFTRGGSTGATYSDKYVELFNPSNEDYSLEGLSLAYATSKADRIASDQELSGTVKAGGYFLIEVGANQGEGGLKLTFDQETGINIAAGGGTLLLVENEALNTVITNAADGLAGDDGVVDAVGWGTAALFEKAAAGVPSSAEQNTHSFGRTDGVDTNSNLADFSVQSPSPMSSKSAVTPSPEPSASPSSDPSPDDPSTDPTNPDQQLTIAEIQGEGDASSHVGQTVVTRGVVTAAYPEGGFNGVYIQTPGDTWDGTASTGIFVYGSAIARDVQIGDYVEVSGKVSEYYDLTEISATSFEVLDEKVPAPEVQEMAAIPGETAEREALEGMLVKVTGPYTVSNNYDVNRYGSLGLAVGDSPILQPSDVYNPSENPKEIAALQAENSRRLITLDDGRSQAYFGTGSKGAVSDVALPYVSATNPVRVGSAVTFNAPMVLDYRFQWNLQPTKPVTTKESGNQSEEFVSFTNTRVTAPAEVGGDISIATFNVLNYFDSLGQDEEGCKFYSDREGNPIATDYCDVRGAYSAEAFTLQEDKIVNALNTMDASIVGLEEIENTSVTDPDRGRDATLKHLVEQLNKAAGSEKWAFVPSPAVDQIPDNEDVIRLAFIYQPALVKPVGASSILDNEWFDGVARQPLAQIFQAVSADLAGTAEPFVVVGNHFKSKGSLSEMIPDDEDTYQGNNNQLRAKEAEALTEWVAEKFADQAVFLIGDFNSYSAEDPVRVIEKAGYVNVAGQRVPGKHTYQFGGMVGSMDHIFANQAAQDLITGADVWNINAMESVAFEYSRFNYNIVDFYDQTPFRSSDHDPIIVGLDVVEGGGVEPSTTPSPMVTVTPSASGTSSPLATASHSSSGQTKAAGNHPSRLEKTGSTVGGILVLGAVLLTAGGALMIRRQMK